MGEPTQIPVTIISGYLGAGKTTLVNHLLRSADGLRLAIMVNEFGDLPIDQDLIISQGDDVIALAGGCVCCSYGDDLMVAMQQMAALENPPDHILLEASGVALPGAIASSLLLIPHLSDDGIIVLVDAEMIRKQAQDKFMYDTVLRQLQDADVIVLNKLDLITNKIADEVRIWLLETAPNASIINSEYSLVDPAVILRSFVGRNRGTYLTNAHRNPLQSQVLTPSDTVDVETFARELADNDRIVRAKGFLKTPSGMKTLQLVGKRWAITDAAENQNVGVVVIGKFLR